MCFKPPDSFVKLIIYYGVSSIFSLCFIILIVENQYSFIAIYIYILILFQLQYFGKKLSWEFHLTVILMMGK